ncbi:4885_t:CDS:2 [Paraglomus brasilianum]|uniref:4885_t:CDS:1 n=1 Tax=Paraglomus brasilianum TaxID=144538 RepID=A0A9N9CLQ6_9GLOM|nr:4885_t:CDS:2 [Paraglomus brasilianum]
MSSQSAIGSLVFFTNALSTASAFHQVFTRTNRRRALSLSSAPPSPAIFPEKLPRSRFKWFKTKRKYSKYTPPPTAVHPHDDDMSSICSESEMYLENRRTLSVPDLPNWNSPMSTSQSTFVHTSLDETLQEEDEEDWDKMIAADEKKTNLFSKRRPSLPPIPLSFPPTRGKAEKRKHNRCKSLPQIPMQDLPNSLYRKPSQRESWDAFYVIETPEIPVPQAVEESQIFIRMDMFNIRDFDSQIKALETLRQQKRTLTESLLPTSRCLGNHPLRSHRNTEPCHDTLEAKYQSYWEEAEVILDLSAQDQTHIFGGGRRIHVGIERTPSERHFHVLKNIIKSELGDDASKVIHQSKVTDDYMVEDIINDDDSDKENRLLEKVNEKKRRRERLRISVDMVPCLIGRLKKLREILSENIKELTVLAQAEGRGVECMGTDDRNLIAS